MTTGVIRMQHRNVPCVVPGCGEVTMIVRSARPRDEIIRTHRCAEHRDRRALNGEVPGGGTATSYMDADGNRRCRCGNRISKLNRGETCFQCEYAISKELRRLLGVH